MPNMCAVCGAYLVPGENIQNPGSDTQGKALAKGLTARLLQTIGLKTNWHTRLRQNGGDWLAFERGLNNIVIETGWLHPCRPEPRQQPETDPNRSNNTKNVVSC